MSNKSSINGVLSSTWGTAESVLSTASTSISMMEDWVERHKRLGVATQKKANAARLLELNAGYTQRASTAVKQLAAIDNLEETNAAMEAALKLLE